MPSDATVLPKSSSRSWASRLWGGLGGLRSTAASRAVRSDAAGLVNGSGHFGGRSLQAATRRLIAEDRYTFVLLSEAADDIDDIDARAGWQALEAQMALVPAGVVPVALPDGSTGPAAVAAFYLDRLAVSNRQFARFVQAGCYDALEIWPREIWPGLLRFTDRSSKPGPRTWEGGTFPAHAADLPVTGICWYEASAYARWTGKRLPTAVEWQKAAGWPEQLSGGTCRRYPWGDLFAEGRANVWAGGPGCTAPVQAYREGATPNGILQLSGNVWEWLEDPLDRIPCRSGEQLWSARPLRRIVGGAYDTYLVAEATNQFITGQPELDRRPNIGFRCAVSIDRLRPAPPSSEPSTRRDAR
jgi:iron(II)-dependent oxidoreductase